MALRACVVVLATTKGKAMSVARWSFGWMVRRIARDIIHGKARFGVAPLDLWIAMWRRALGPRCGLFRNKDGVIGFRWGFYVLGFEFGNRNPGTWPEDRC